jgi:hypothetical protein
MESAKDLSEILAANLIRKMKRGAVRGERRARNPKRNERAKERACVATTMMKKIAGRIMTSMVGRN